MAAWCPSWPRATTSVVLVPLVPQRAGSRQAAAPGRRWTSWPTPAAPGLAGALLVGAGLQRPHWPRRWAGPLLGVHHLEGPPAVAVPVGRTLRRFPFVALLVSGGHTQLMQRAGGVGDYELLGETIDDAAGEAFDKSAKLLGLGYPGGPALSRLARAGRCRRRSPCRGRMLAQRRPGTFSFAGLKTAVLTQVPAAAKAASAAERCTGVPTWPLRRRPPSWTCWCKQVDARPARRRAWRDWWWPAAFGRQRALLRERARMPPAPSARAPRALPRAAPVQRQRRDDRPGRRPCDARPAVSPSCTRDLTFDVKPRWALGHQPGPALSSSVSCLAGGHGALLAPGASVSTPLSSRACELNPGPPPAASVKLRAKLDVERSRSSTRSPSLLGRRRAG